MKAARVLIVDDDRSSAVAICCYLEFKGHDVAVAASVDEALTVAENLVPEILICDWKLGEDRDGIDVARLLNDRYELTIIFMTAHEPDELQRKLDGLTPAGCFRKPVVLEELVQAMGHPPSSGYVLAVSCRKVMPSSQSDDTYGSTVAKWDEQTARWQMNAH